VGIHEPLFPVVIGLAVMAVTTLVGAIALDAARWRSRGAVWGLLLALRHKRGQYAGWLIHLGVFCLAVGVAGSSLGSRQHELVLEPDQSIEWAGRQVRIVRRDQRRTADKLIAEVELAVDGHGRTVHLHPARHFHLLTQTWTTEVAIDSTWRGDFYVVLHGGDQQGNVRLTLVSNPLIRWIWLGGWIAGLATLIRLVPGRRRRVVQGSKKQTIRQRTEPTSVAPVRRAA
jgi:cytochrome c-type biogenesis protein CcmF